MGRSRKSQSLRSHEKQERTIRKPLPLQCQVSKKARWRSWPLPQEKKPSQLGPSHWSKSHLRRIWILRIPGKRLGSYWKNPPPFERNHQTQQTRISRRSLQRFERLQRYQQNHRSSRHHRRNDRFHKRWSNQSLDQRKLRYELPKPHRWRCQTRWRNSRLKLGQCYCPKSRTWRSICQWVEKLQIIQHCPRFDQKQRRSSREHSRSQQNQRRTILDPRPSFSFEGHHPSRPSTCPNTRPTIGSTCPIHNRSQPPICLPTQPPSRLPIMGSTNLNNQPRPNWRSISPIQPNPRILKQLRQHIFLSTSSIRLSTSESVIFKEI